MTKTVADVLRSAQWQDADEGQERARRADERARAMELEQARKAKQARADEEAELVRMGRPEYRSLPAARRKAKKMERAFRSQEDVAALVARAQARMAARADAMDEVLQE